MHRVRGLACSVQRPYSQIEIAVSSIEKVNGEAGSLINGAGGCMYCGEPPSKLN
jgi:hypothetical protein